VGGAGAPPSVEVVVDVVVTHPSLTVVVVTVVTGMVSCVDQQAVSFGAM
jgi:Zn finger protein HypA/HybF involved in hydrogenase expression